MTPNTPLAPAATLKWLWAAVGALGVSVLALGGTLLAQNLRGDAAPAAQGVAAAARTPESEIIEEKAQKMPPAHMQQALNATDLGANGAAPQAYAQARPQPQVQPYPQPSAQGYAQPRPAPAPVQRGDPYLQPATQRQAAAPVCASCGRVESVRAIEQAAPATGVGAVAGGVLGGVLGNQIGKGSGRTAATVLGAVGGGYVGHQVEQRTRTTTVYQMRVRMDDGSVRSFTRSQPVAEGTPVRAEGKGFRVDDRAATGAQPVYVSDRSY